MRTVSACGALLLVSLGAAEAVHSKYYDVSVNGADGPDIGRMLDALHDQLEDYFGVKSETRLQVEIFDTRDQFVAALKADHQMAVAGGGYYAPQTRKAYLFRQPSVYYTRQLILHEATHQFHFLYATHNSLPRAGWYTEGMAEHFGMHNWNGETLQTGVIPAISLEDYPAKALAQLEPLSWDIRKIASQEVVVDRPVGWALVTFLLEKHREQFQLLAHELDNHASPKDAWDKCGLETLCPNIDNEFKDWVQAHQQPWKCVWINWVQSGEYLIGYSDRVGIAILKSQPKRIDLEMKSEASNVKAGFTFGFKSANDFMIAQLAGPEKLNIYHRHDGRWERIASKDLNAAASKLSDIKLTLELLPSNKARVLVDGVDEGTYDADGQVGLNLDGARVAFRVKLDQ